MAYEVEAPPQSSLLEPCATPASEGRVVAVKVCSHVLDACVWLAFNSAFEPDPDEPLAVFYEHEIPLLEDKTPDDLKQIHRTKLAFGPGTEVRTMSTGGGRSR